MISRARLYTLHHFRAEEGYCRLATLHSGIPSSTTQTHSPLRVFEDGIELGPGNSLHDDIRRFGSGRFSHWGNQLYFSSSDGVPPESNRRTYHILCPGSGHEANLLLAALSTSNFDTMSLDQRYAALEQIAAVFAPGVHLSEFERTMFSDVDFRQDYERFSTSNYRSFDRKFAMREFVRLAMKSGGHIAECGVFKGASAYILAKELERCRSNSSLHLYDSFEGLSQPMESDGSYWHKGDMLGRLDEVKSNLMEFESLIIYHQGWIPRCFDFKSTNIFSFVHIDVDLYQPTLDSLAYFYPRMAKHGIILCDDYGFNTCPGARKALDEFFLARGDQVLHLPTGQGVVICGLIF